MSKKFVSVMIVLSFLFIACLPNLGESDELDACYRKKNGKLRVVESSSQCKRKEHHITLLTGQDNGDGDGDGDEDYEYLTDQLACVTGYIAHGSEKTCEEISSQVGNEFSDGEFCGGTTNEQNFTIEKFGDVFIKETEQTWGLSCNSDNGWVNTGCIQNLKSEPVEIDNTNLAQNSNGCFSNNLDSLAIGVTCCKIIQEKDEYITELILKLRKDFEEHTHTYLTGKGKGHNKTEANTTKPNE